MSQPESMNEERAREIVALWSSWVDTISVDAPDLIERIEKNPPPVSRLDYEEAKGFLSGLEVGRKERASIKYPGCCIEECRGAEEVAALRSKLERVESVAKDWIEKGCQGLPSQARCAHEDDRWCSRCSLIEQLGNLLEAALSPDETPKREGM